MKPIVRLGIFLMQLFGQAISAQQGPLDFNLVKGANGIALGKINGITQDRSGYMWFADAGNKRLIRFDGYRMKSYEYDPSDSNSLDNKSGTECIAADSSGCIWTNASTGIDKFDPATNKFIHYRYSSNELGDRLIYNILVDHLGMVWVGTSGGLDCLDQKTGKFTHYTHKDNDPTSLSCNMVRTLYEDHEGVLWIGTGWEFDPKIKEGGLNRFNRKTGTFTRYMHDPNNSHSLIGDKVRGIFEDSRGVFWVGTDGDGLHIMDRKTETFERLTYDPSQPEKLSRPPVKTGNDWSDHITFITEDGAGEIWIGTYYAGLVRYDPITKKIARYDSTDKVRSKGFKDNSGWCAFTSRDGVLWMSTEFPGNHLFRIDPLQANISNINMGEEVEKIYEDTSGVMWMGFRNNGLLKMDPNKGDKKYFKHDPSDPYSISSSKIFFIQPDTDGFFWVGTWNGLNRFDSKTGRFTRYLYNKISKGDYVDTAVFNLLKGDNGEIYLSTVKGFIIMNSQTGLMKLYVNDPSDTTSISANFATALCKDKSGNLWIGTWSNAGLNFLNIKTKKFKHYLVGSIIRSIYKDTRGTIWVGTNNGLYYRNDSTNSFTAIEEAGKEFRTAALQVNLEDKDKNLWGSSSLGIFRFNAQKGELCLYGQKFSINDYPENDFRLSFKTPDGRLMFSNDSGYYSFLPRDVINTVPPEIVVSDFKINGHSANPGKNVPFKGSLEEAKEMKLQYNQNTFSIDFAAIHYSSPEDNSQYYMLEGYDNDWLKADSLKTADYKKIEPGKYTLKIKASSSYGVWSEKEVKIVILPPWWLTWWAYTIYALVFLLALWGIIKWRTMALEKEKRLLEEKVAIRTQELEKEKEKVESTLSQLKSTQAQLIAEKEAKLLADFNQKFSESELKALRAQMNPHFVFNILNTIESYALDNNKEAASVMIQKFSRLTRMVLENSMNQLVPFQNDLKSLQLYIELEQMRYADKFMVAYNIQEQIMEGDYLIPPMIIQPFVENAILHGLRNKPNNNGILNLSANLQNGYIIVQVEDNGIGRTKAAALKANNPIHKNSLGIKVTQDRISMFNNLNQDRKAKVEIQDLNEGTRVVIQLPVSQLD